MNLVERILRERQEKKKQTQSNTMRPRTVLEPDRTTFYCDVLNKRFSYRGAKILYHYANGDCVVLTANGVQFTAKADEIFYIRKGDYHEVPSI